MDNIKLDMSVTRHPSAADTPRFWLQQEIFVLSGIPAAKTPSEKCDLPVQDPFLYRELVTPLVMSSDAMMVP